MRNAPLAVLLVALAACAEPTPSDAGLDAGLDAGEAPSCEAPDAGAGDEGITRGCAQGVIASGLALRVEGPALPLARLGAHLRAEAPEICAPGTALSGVTLVTAVDARAPGALARASYHVLGERPISPTGDAGAGPLVRVERGSVSLEPSADAPLASAPELFDLGAAGLDGFAAIAVVLDGIELDADVPQEPSYPRDYDPGDGYAIRALGASIEGVTRTGPDLRFTVGARLELGRSGEAAMDRAAAVARVRVIVRYAVVALPMAPPTGSVAYDTECRPGADVGTLALDAPAGARAAPALTAFSIELDDGVEGTFVRELAVAIEGFAIDASGRATMRVGGFVEGRVPAPQHVEADVALLAWSGGDAIEALRAVHAVSPGVSETPLPLRR